MATSAILLSTTYPPLTTITGEIMAANFTQNNEPNQELPMIRQEFSRLYGTFVDVEWAIRSLVMDRLEGRRSWMELKWWLVRILRVSSANCVGEDQG